MTKPLEYDTYLKERAELVKYQQSSYDSFEKLIVTLAAGFLAFSLSFLSLLQKKTGVVPVELEYLVTAWIAFGASVLILLLCFPLNILAYRTEIMRIEQALTDARAFSKRNWYTYISNTFYVFAGLAFIVGLFSLIWFATENRHLIERRQDAESGRFSTIKQAECRSRL